MKYIAADNLKEHKFIDWSIPEFTSEMSLVQQAYHRGWNDAIDAIVENEPTADVVEVVRCKDCKHYRKNISCVGGLYIYNGCSEWLNEGNEIEVREDDYCSYGEMREDAAQD